MTQVFVDPQTPFADMARDAAAEEWGKQAANLAKAAGQSVDVGSVDHWLDQSERADDRLLQTTNPEGYRDRRDRAASRAQAHAQLMAIWRS
jgi:hypothetical protein